MVKWFILIIFSLTFQKVQIRSPAKILFHKILQINLKSNTRIFHSISQEFSARIFFCFKKCLCVKSLSRFRIRDRLTHTRRNHWATIHNRLWTLHTSMTWPLHTIDPNHVCDILASLSPIPGHRSISWLHAIYTWIVWNWNIANWSFRWFCDLSRISRRQRSTNVNHVSIWWTQPLPWIPDILSGKKSE